MVKAALLENIDHFSENIHLSKVQSFGSGGVLVGCRSSEDNNKFRKIASEKLSSKYEIRKAKGINPSIHSGYQ